MMYSETTALRKIRALRSRTRIVQGGSAAGKTIAILLTLINTAQTEKGLLISVVSESLPHLRKGALRDFLSIMEGHDYFKEDSFNRSELTYTYETGSKIEFFSADQPGKVRGPRRDILYVNEANAISYETFTQLAIRTNKYIFIDHNPVSSYWAHEEVVPNHEHDFIILNYKDNEHLPEAIVRELESRKGNKNFWTVYGLGQIGDTEGKIYTDWKIIDEVPHEARLVRRGMDFGYTNDPTAIVDVYRHDGGHILDELCFLKGMSNRQIADLLNAQDDRGVLTIADSAEPKSIDELKEYGINVIGAQKGPGSVSQGIQKVRDQRISVTKRSTNIIREFRNYLFLKDKEGKITNEPDHAFSHSMDAIRYAMETLVDSPMEAVQVPSKSMTAYKYGANRRPNVPL